jgi:hypothetical protein
MSKMDNLRAMREARYEQAAARAGKPTARKPAIPRVVASGTADDLPEQEAALCGHRNMGGRTCTREAGHAAKSHRYA